MMFISVTTRWDVTTWLALYNGQKAQVCMLPSTREELLRFLSRCTTNYDG